MAVAEKASCRPCVPQGVRWRNQALESHPSTFLKAGCQARVLTREPESPGTFMQLVLITETPLVQWALPEQVPCDVRSNSSVTAAPRGCACLPGALSAFSGWASVLHPRAHRRPRVREKELQMTCVSFMPCVLASSFIETRIFHTLCMKVGSRIWEAKSQSFREQWSCTKSSVSAAGHQRKPTCTQASALQPGPRRAGTEDHALRAATLSAGEVVPQAALPVPRCR